MTELSAKEIPLQDRLTRIFDDARGSDTLVELLDEFGFESSRDLAEAIVAAMAIRVLTGGEADWNTRASVAEVERLREALRECRRAISNGREEPRRTVREIVDRALGGEHG